MGTHTRRTFDGWYPKHLGQARERTLCYRTAHGGAGHGPHGVRRGSPGNSRARGSTRTARRPHPGRGKARWHQPPLRSRSQTHHSGPRDWLPTLLLTVPNSTSTFDAGGQASPSLVVSGRGDESHSDGGQKPGPGRHRLALQWALPGPLRRAACWELQEN